VLVPHYALMHQTGMDAVVTLDNLALKLEALRRETSDEAFVAAVGGFEYTMVGVFDSNLDLGLLAEYHADERGARASTPFNHDLFAGARLALNDVDDTSMLLGLIADVQGGGNFFNFEAGRRFGDRWRADLELRAFWSVPRRALLFALARDDYVQLTLSRYF
jgi:hypothetical protein